MRQTARQRLFAEPGLDFAHAGRMASAEGAAIAASMLICRTRLGFRACGSSGQRGESGRQRVNAYLPNQAWISRMRAEWPTRKKRRSLRQRLFAEPGLDFAHAGHLASVEGAAITASMPICRTRSGFRACEPSGRRGRGSGRCNGRTARSRTRSFPASDSARARARRPDGSGRNTC